MTNKKIETFDPENNCMYSEEYHACGYCPDICPHSMYCPWYVPDEDENEED